MSLRHAILGVLRNGPLHGYRLLTELDALIAGGRFNSAQVYQGLRWLAGHSFVSASPLEPGLSRDRRPFAITPKGNKEFLRWLRAPIVPNRPSRDDALVKLVFLGREDVGQLVGCLERLRKMHVRRLSAVLPKPTTPMTDSRTDLFMELSAVALRFREEAEILWIDHCLRRLRATSVGAEVAVSPADAHRVARVER